MVGLVPMLILDAPTPGTGKGLCVKCIAFLALGAIPAMKPQPESEAEWRKSITALLVDLPVHVIFDNLAGTLRSDALCMMLTTEIWVDRELGTMRTVQVPIRCVPMGTANNLEVAGDLPRRLVWCRLDAKMERPDERKPEKFSHPYILAWAAEHQGELVHAALVLVQAWIARGKKPGSQTMGSYEAWAQTMGGILDVAGVKGFLANAAKKRKRSDEDSAQWRAFCTKWWQEYRTNDVGAKEFFELAEAEDLLPWVMNAETDLGKRQKLGRAVSKMVGRRFGDYRILDADTEGRGGTRQYKLEKIIEQTDSMAGNPLNQGGDRQGKADQPDATGKEHDARSEASVSALESGGSSTAALEQFRNMLNDFRSHQLIGPISPDEYIREMAGAAKNTRIDQNEYFAAFQEGWRNCSANTEGCLDVDDRLLATLSYPELQSQSLYWHNLALKAEPQWIDDNLDA
jgi:hypothetical protein